MLRSRNRSLIVPPVMIGQYRCVTDQGNEIQVLLPSRQRNLSLRDTTPWRNDTLPEWLRWQECLHATPIELCLDRCIAVAERMGLLTPPFSVVTIAGTNGKGSSATMLDLIFRHAGYRVGKYMSPHLLRYNERICADGQEITNQGLCEAFNRVDGARGNISLTYFEFGTLAALDYFMRSNIDIAILEVGLGGRLDAVNMLDADVALLTTVDLDHEYWLGVDRERIGREKAGIFRPNRPAICADPNPPGSVMDVAASERTDLSIAGNDFSISLNGDTEWNWSGKRLKFDSLPIPDPHHEKQLQNAAGVLGVVEAMLDRWPVPEHALRRALSEFDLPGRFQIINHRVPIILDVAHNPQAVAVLAENLRRLPCSGKTHVVIGMLKDKNHLAIVQLLSEITDQWYVSSLPGDRGTEAKQLSAVLRCIIPTQCMGMYANVETALSAAIAMASPGDRVVVTGSFLTVGAALQWLDAEVRKCLQEGPGDSIPDLSMHTLKVAAALRRG